MFKWLKNSFSKTTTPIVEESKKTPERNLQEAESQTETWRKQGNYLLDQNKFEEAANCYRQALEHSPSDVACLINLGFALTQLQRFDEAKRALESALKFEQHNADACFSLGQIEQGNQQFDQAISLYQRALLNKQDFDFCRQQLCALLFHLGRFADALRYFDERPFLAIDSLDYFQFKAELHLRLEQTVLAQQHFEKALILAPENQSVLLQLACIDLRMRRLDRAQQRLEKILEANPKHGEARGFLAACFQLRGQVKEACRQYQEAIQLEANNLTLHQNYLYALSYTADCSPEDYLIEARAFAAKLRQAQGPQNRNASPVVATEHRPLRLGFVSGDLRAHPVGLFLENVLSTLDKTQFYCVAYANQVLEDDVSLRLQAHFQIWNTCSTLDDKTLADQIRKDEIDILIDLAGHTERNRLGVFILKPAAMQIAWLGYWASTGLSEIDYILVDKTSVPSEEGKHFSETPLYLDKTRLCMSPPRTTRSIEVVDTPALSTSKLCFGSFQVPNKITDSTIALWAKTLIAVPNACLRLQNTAFEFDSARQDMISRFVAHGVQADRIQFVGGMGYTDYLASHAEVDIILDTHPFPGGTTTAEAIWMGVPTITLKGSTLLSRQGESMLRCVGLDAWVANNEEDFVQIATKYAADILPLNRIRRSLRQTALASPLFDARQFTRNFEQVILDAWQQHQSN